MYCPNQTEYNIFAADNLLNGTFRLFSGFHYIDLVLMARTGNHTDLFSISYGRHQFIPVVHSQGEIKNVFNNLSHNFIDTSLMHTTVFSLSDRQKNEYPFVLISQPANRHSINGKLYYFNGPMTFAEEFSIGYKQYLKNEMKSDVFLQIIAAFRVYTNNGQYLFAVINKQVLVKNQLESFYYIISLISCFGAKLILTILLCPT